jgi:23S rRNA (uracil1939-C5)-methyltransferase
MTSPLPVNLRCAHFPACGGCDFLDLDEKSYRILKQNSLQQLELEAEWIWVGAASRRRIIFQVDIRNRLGFFAKKSNEVVEINSCLVAKKEIANLILPLKNLLKNFEENVIEQIAATLFDNGVELIFSAKRELNSSQIQKLSTFAKEQNLNLFSRIKNHLTPISLVRKNQIFLQDLKINLDSETFLQATESGLAAIIKIISQNLEPSQKVIDIYAGFGAYSFAICHLVKKVFAVEGSAQMVEIISKNAAANQLCDKIKAETRDIFTNPLGTKELKNFDVAIINPPRNGGSPQVLEISKSNLKKVVYVSCNPQTFKRDCKILTDANFVLKKLYALDQFYATKHLELIAIFEKF